MHKLLTKYNIQHSKEGEYIIYKITVVDPRCICLEDNIIIEGGRETREVVVTDNTNLKLTNDICVVYGEFVGEGEYKIRSNELTEDILREQIKSFKKVGGGCYFTEGFSIIE